MGVEWGLVASARGLQHPAMPAQPWKHSFSTCETMAVFTALVNCHLAKEAERALKLSQEYQTALSEDREKEHPSWECKFQKEDTIKSVNQI